MSMNNKGATDPKVNIFKGRYCQNYFFLYWCNYPHRSKDSVSHVCRIFYSNHPCCFQDANLPPPWAPCHPCHLCHFCRHQRRLCCPGHWWRKFWRSRYVSCQGSRRLLSCYWPAAALGGPHCGRSRPHLWRLVQLVGVQLVLFCPGQDTNTTTLLTPPPRLRYCLATFGHFPSCHNTRDNDKTSSYLTTGSTQWVPGPPLNRPTENPCAVSISASKILLIGSLPDTHGVEEYDTITRAWTSLADLTVWRYSHSCSIIGDTVLIAGSASKETFQALLSTTILDISSRRPGDDLDVARIYFHIVNHKDKLLATGELGPDNQGTYPGVARHRGGVDPRGGPWYDQG